MTAAQPDNAADARRMIREARTAVLSTLMAGTGAPYGSLAQTAVNEKGIIILLLSRLAVHTRNLLADPRASLLIVDQAGAASPLEGARLAIAGKIAVTTRPEDAACYRATHPEAEMFAGFADFAFYAFAPEGAHLVAGFGRIVDLSARDLLPQT